jgi:drug/metabolite transporter (DMT)-like permease
VSTYAFVNPVVALSLGWAVGDDTIGVRTIVAATLVIAAVLLARERSSSTRVAVNDESSGARARAA